MRVTGFMWLEQYLEKLAWKYDAPPEEVETLFALTPRFRFVERGHSASEICMLLSAGRRRAVTSIVFFIHKLDGRALIISARDMDDSEKRLYGRK